MLKKWRLLLTKLSHYVVNLIILWQNLIMGSWFISHIFILLVPGVCISFLFFHNNVTGGLLSLMQIPASHGLLVDQIIPSSPCSMSNSFTANIITLVLYESCNILIVCFVGWLVWAYWTRAEGWRVCVWAWYKIINIFNPFRKIIIKACFTVLCKMRYWNAIER